MGDKAWIEAAARARNRWYADNPYDGDSITEPGCQGCDAKAAEIQRLKRWVQQEEEKALEDEPS